MNPELKFAIEATYDKFANQWKLVIGKSDWIEAWSPLLGTFAVSELNAIADYCVKQYRRPPVPGEVIELALRFREGKPLEEPIVSKLERMAYLILSNDEFHDSTFSPSEVRDACLIAAAIANKKIYAEVFPEMTPETAVYLKSEFAERARMFTTVTDEWEADAAEGKGYWVDILARKKSA